MKSTLIILLLAFFQPKLTAQSLAINANTTPSLSELKTSVYTIPQAKKHCNAVRVGEVLMISGGAVAIAGGIGLASITTGPDGDLGAGGLLSYMVIGAGGIVMVGGIVVFIIGEVRDHQHKQPRVTLISKSNEFGVAYNF